MTLQEKVIKEVYASISDKIQGDDAEEVYLSIEQAVLKSFWDFCIPTYDNSLIINLINNKI